ncbi:MAG: type IV pilus twitching motility protein PilT [Bacteriovoracaceae bacterium]|nr:type IV pilus twitching motility protein PilT [Bacteriovoracaceae bacterium]
MANEEQDKTGVTQKADQGSSLRIQHLFKLMVDNGSSDLHLTAGSPPVMRISGEMVKVKTNVLDGNSIKALVYSILSEEQRNTFEKHCELDLSFGIKGLARFRGNVFYSKNVISAVFRLIPSVIPEFEALGLPKVLLQMTQVNSGLILVTGPTGSGKSTTLASILDSLNRNESGHIITLEDPIEFIHKHKRCIVNQREIGSDTESFAKAIKGVLRQDPDIVLIGELRDPVTIEAALTIAETGHLVFGTLHTNSCVQTINRIVNVFPSDQQDQIRTLLSFVLQGVVAQKLIPKTFEPGRSLALEVLIPTLGIRNLIRENKIHQLYSQMQVGQQQTGMMTMNQNLKKLVEIGAIDATTAMNYTTVPEELANMLGIKKTKGI